MITIALLDEASVRELAHLAHFELCSWVQFVALGPCPRRVAYDFFTPLLTPLKSSKLSKISLRNSLGRIARRTPKKVHWDRLGP